MPVFDVIMMNVHILNSIYSICINSRLYYKSICTERTSFVFYRTISSIYILSMESEKNCTGGGGGGDVLVSQFIIQEKRSKEHLTPPARHRGPINDKDDDVSFTNFT